MTKVTAVEYGRKLGLEVGKTYYSRRNPKVSRTIINLAWNGDSLVVYYQIENKWKYDCMASTFNGWRIKE
jgi:hypothetical protein